MITVVRKQTFSEYLYLLDIKIESIARTAQPGQYVDVRLNPDMTALTLPVIGTNAEAGTITVVHRAQDLPSEQLMMLQEGDEIFLVKGPLGDACNFDAENKVVLVGEGLGVASLLPRARGYRDRGVYTICVLGFESQEDVFLQEEFSEICDELYVVTVDGSYGVKGKVVGPLRAICETHKDIDQAVLVAQLANMKRSAKIAENAGIPTRVSFDAVPKPAGSASVFDKDDKPQETFSFARAPELDATSVDFDKLLTRQRALQAETGVTPAS